MRRALRIDTAVEIGHIFKLGYKYSESMGARVLDKNGKEVTPIMGSYGIGIERILTAAVEQSNDENGFWLPPQIAPFEIVVTPTNVGDEKLLQTAVDIAAAWRPPVTTSYWTTGTNGPGSSSRMRTWSVSPFVSPWGRRLPKVPWKWFNARLGKCEDASIAAITDYFEKNLRSASLSRFGRMTERGVRNENGSSVYS